MTVAWHRRPIECPTVRRSVLLLALISSFTFILGVGRPAITDSDEGFFSDRLSAISVVDSRTRTGESWTPRAHIQRSSSGL